MQRLSDLTDRRSLLRTALRSEGSSEERGRLHLELGILEKLLGRGEGIEPAFRHLRQALELLPPEAREERQRALFVLGLTHGDVSEARAAVSCFESVSALDSQSRAGAAARGYAAAYRERFRL